MQTARRVNLPVQLSKLQAPSKACEGLEACRLHIPPPCRGTKDGEKMEDAVVYLALQWSGTAGGGKGGNLT